MNNWRLLLLAVVAVLQPIESYTERNPIDGRQECCDNHRSNSFDQEIKIHENYRNKNTPEHRRLKSGDVREARQRSDARISSRDRLTVERTERRVSPESVARFKTEATFAKGLQRLQRSNIAWESRQTRDDQSRKYRESISKDSLSRYERDMDSKLISMSREKTRTQGDNDERVFREYSNLQNNRRVSEFGDLRRVYVNREDMLHRRERKEIVRHGSHRNFRVSASQTENRLHHNNYNRESRNMDQRVREITNENRRSRSLQSRLDSFERDSHRASFRSSFERVDARSRDQSKPSRDRTITLQDSSERIFGNRMREFPEAKVPVEQIKRIMNDYRTKNIRIDVRDTAAERLVQLFGKNDEQRHTLYRESRTLDANVQFGSIVRSNNRQGTKRSRMLGEIRQERRPSLSRSLDRTRSNEREINTRLSERTFRVAKAVDYRKDIRSNEKLEERREQRYRTRTSRNRQISVPRESRESAERRQETRSLTRFEISVRSDRELKLHGRDFVRSDDRHDRKDRSASREQAFRRMTRNTPHRLDGKLVSGFRFAGQANSDNRFSEVRDNTRPEARNENRARTVVKQLTRDVSTPHGRSDIRRTHSNTRLTARTLANVQDEWRVTERDERVSRNRISVSQLSRKRIEKREPQEMKHFRANVRNEMIENRVVRITQKESHRHEDSRSQDRVLQQQYRDMLTARSVERRSREHGARDVKIQSERLSNERDIRQRDFRTVETRRESSRLAEREVLPNRHNLAMERRALRDIGIEAKLRFDTILTKDLTRGDARDTRFKNYAAQFREINHVENADDKNAMSWQMVFYALQGAYLCGLLMQMLTEKSNKGKSRNITAWWYPAPKDLVKVE